MHLNWAHKQSAIFGYESFWTDDSNRSWRLDSSILERFSNNIEEVQEGYKSEHNVASMRLIGLKMIYILVTVVFFEVLEIW